LQGGLDEAYHWLLLETMASDDGTAAHRHIRWLARPGRLASTPYFTTQGLSKLGNEQAKLTLGSGIGCL